MTNPTSLSQIQKQKRQIQPLGINWMFTFDVIKMVERNTMKCLTIFSRFSSLFLCVFDSPSRPTTPVSLAQKTNVPYPINETVEHSINSQGSFVTLSIEMTLIDWFHCNSSRLRITEGNQHGRLGVRVHCTGGFWGLEVYKDIKYLNSIQHVHLSQETLLWKKKCWPHASPGMTKPSVRSGHQSRFMQCNFMAAW